MMHEIAIPELSQAFVDCWRAAVRHFENCANGPFDSWLRVHLEGPFLEHLSFRLGNQNFFVRVEDADELLDVPGTREGLLYVAQSAGGHACVLPMRRAAGNWVAELPGWGLVDARTGAQIDPVGLITEELIEMTDWEIYGFAIQVVSSELEERGFRVATHVALGVDPAVWFERGDSEPEWVVVRAARYPARAPPPPTNWSQMPQFHGLRGRPGHFASVIVANAFDPYDASLGAPLPIWRGHALHAWYAGLDETPVVEPRRLGLERTGGCQAQ